MYFSFQQIFKLLRVTEEVTGVGAWIKTGEIKLLDFVFDVILPEVRWSVEGNYWVIVVNMLFLWKT